MSLRAAFEEAAFATPELSSFLPEEDKDPQNISAPWFCCKFNFNPLKENQSLDVPPDTLHIS